MLWHRHQADHTHYVAADLGNGYVQSFTLDPGGKSWLLKGPETISSWSEAMLANVMERLD